MKRIFLSSLFICVIFLFQRSSAQMQLNMSLLSTWDDNSLPTNWVGPTCSFNDCWGYVDSLDREYAFIGSTMGTHIFDITNATNPVLVSYQQGREASGNVVHRDFKTYQHYLYGVCDEGNSSLQIFDLKYMPDSVHKVYDSQQICKTAHNIFIDNGRIYFLGLKDSTGTPITVRVASLANPVNPVVINDLSTPLFSYVHDACVRKDTVFLSCGYDGFFIYDYTNPTSPALIQSITNYPEQGYNHSSWVSVDGKTVVFADETHGMGLKVYDISTLSNPVLKSIFRSNLLNDPGNNGNGYSIPHNPFIVANNKVFISYYHDGVQCFDISNPTSPVQVGYYDTYPANTDYNNYAGCWGTYPFLPSHHIIGSDISNGLFVLDGSQLLGVNSDISSSNDILIFPNPNCGKLVITSNELYSQQIRVDIYDELGRKIYSVPAYCSGNPIDVSSLKEGIYLVQVTGGNYSYTKKIIRSN